MKRLLFYRAIHTLFLLFAISVLSFALLKLAPGTYLDELRVNQQVSSATIDQLRLRYGLDQPLSIQYVRWLKMSLRGDLGFSFAYNAPVGPLLLGRAGNTLLLTGTATLVAWILAIGVGVWSCAGTHPWPARIIGAGTSLLLVIPELLLALVFLWFAVRTHLLPVGGMTSPQFANQGPLQRAYDVTRHLVLPVSVLVLSAVPVLVRHVRAAMVEVLSSPSIRAARAHGLPHGQMLFVYALRLAANPLISLFGISIAGLLSASMVVEVIMGWPGLGPIFVEAILARDVYVVIGTVMFSSAFVIFGNLFADVLLYSTDPRIRSSS